MQTNFLKFLIEKYDRGIQELPEEETNLPDNKLSDEFDRIVNGDEIQDEIQDEPENDEENIDDLRRDLQARRALTSNRTGLTIGLTRRRLWQGRRRQR